MHQITTMGLVGLSALFIASCGAQIAEMHGIPIVEAANEAEVRSEVEIERDPHVGQTIVKGPVIFHDDNILGNTYMVRAWINPGNDLLDGQFQIYVTGRFNNWAFLNQAYSQGERLDTTQISRDVSNCSRYGCRHTETIGINLSEEEISQYTVSGITFRVTGQRDSITMTVPGPYISAVLEGYRRERERSPGA